jgi:hypothetical protein
MPVIVKHEGDGSSDMEPLNFELAGIIDVIGVMNKLGIDKLQEFMQVGHPNKLGIKYRPAIVISVAPALKAQGNNAVPFGVLLATKEANPGSSRNLITRAELSDYRSQFAAIEFDPSWSSWEMVAQQFSPKLEAKHESSPSFGM